MQWYYAKDNTQFGPVEQSELVARIAAGDVAATDLVWREGLPDWVPSGQIHELGRPPVLPDRGQEPASGEVPVWPYAPPTAAPVAPYGPVPSNGKATASMVLGIISTTFAVGNLCCVATVLVTIPCGILAIVFGNQVKQAASLDPSLQGELRKVKAGIVTGWVGIGLSVAAAVSMGLFFAFAARGK